MADDDDDIAVFDDETNSTEMLQAGETDDAILLGDDATESVTVDGETVEAPDMTDDAIVAPVHAASDDDAGAPAGVPEVSDAGVFSVMIMASALLYLFALVVVLVWLREYSSPLRFLRFW